MREADLYPPVKAYLQAQGYTVKAEVGRCDVTARRGDGPLVVVELKRQLNLQLLLQAVDRLRLSDAVYIAVPHTCRLLTNKRKQTIKLRRMLGLGLLSVTDGSATALLDPTPYKPRPSHPLRRRLLREFEQREGDPNIGGIPRKGGVMTAYRQRALRIAQFLDANGQTKASAVAAQTGDVRAREVLYRNVYGWFDRLDTGIYALSPRGQREVPAWLERHTR